LAFHTNGNVGRRADQINGIVIGHATNVVGKNKAGTPAPNILLIYINTGANGLGSFGVHQKR